MRAILVFNDGSWEAANAEQFALTIAQKVKADLVILNLVKKENLKASKKLVKTGVHAIKYAGVNEPFEAISAAFDDDFKPATWEIDASAYSEKDISELVISKNIWLMVKGIETHITHELLYHVDVQSVINHVGCPLLLIPDDYRRSNFENVAYAVDMRYCRRSR